MLKSLTPLAVVSFFEYTRRFEKLGFCRRAAVACALSSHRRRQLVTSGVELLPAPLRTRRMGYVIDVGANKGQFLTSFLSVLDADEVDSFEPNPEAYGEILNVIRSSRWEGKVQAHNLALGSETGTCELNITSSSEFSSLLRPHSELERQFGGPAVVVKRTAVSVKRLDDCAKSKPVDLLKIDVQGFERQVIAGATQLLSRTKAILMEVSFKRYYQGDSDFLEIVGLLSDQHKFRLYNLSDPWRDADYRAGQADAVFVASNLFS
jgi:FkbM family methyltransferase